MKGEPRPVRGASEERVIGHARIKPFDFIWTGLAEGDVRTVVIAGLLPVLHVALDGAVLVRARGSYRLYVGQDHILQFPIEGEKK